MKGKLTTMNSKQSLLNEDIYVDQPIDFSDNPVLTPERATKGWVCLPDGTHIVKVKMDRSTFKWFEKQGSEFDEQIEKVLRNYAISNGK